MVWDWHSVLNTKNVGSGGKLSFQSVGWEGEGGSNANMMY